jgi:preprotein translocase subunit YajC
MKWKGSPPASGLACGYFDLLAHVYKMRRIVKGIVMKMHGKPFARLSLLFLASGTIALALAAGVAAQSQDQGAPPPSGQRRGQRGPNDGQGQPLIGKITAIKDGTVELAKPDGTAVTVKITDKTEYRKDRQPAKLGDFKVGDMVLVRGEEDTNHGVTASMIAGRSGGGPEGGRGFGGGGGNSGGFGELGKDFVIGEVKSVDAPKITILRPDNVTQTMELNEETSLRKGRDSITMADIQPGDHIVVRGGVQNNAFVPKSVMVISPEQWKRMQEMGMMPTGNAPVNPPKSNPQQP